MEKISAAGSRRITSSTRKLFPPQTQSMLVTDALGEGSCRGGGKARGEAKRKKWYFQLIRRVRRLRKRLLRDLETVRRNGSDYRRDRWCDRKCLIFAVRGNSSAAMIKRQIR
jgi:hypothetical protein